MNSDGSKLGCITISYFLLGVLLPLLIGGIVYYLIAPDVYFVRAIDGCLSKHYHIYVDLNQNYMVRLIRYYMLDFLWSFSFTNVVLILYAEHLHLLRIGLFVPFIVGGIIETLQLYGIVVGSADIYDLIVEIIGSLGAELIFTCVRRTWYEGD